MKEIDLACKISVTNHIAHYVEMTFTFDLGYFLFMLWPRVILLVFIFTLPYSLCVSGSKNSQLL
jgi:hypothetical protein